MDCDHLIKTITIDMINWLLDCFEDDYDQDTIKELDFQAAKKAVNKYYDGGYYQFLKDAHHHA